MSFIVTLLVISLIVFIHELGHFLFAKLNKVGVREFSIGFGPRLLSFKKGETRYSIKAVLLGGACEMEGMLEDSEADVINEKSFITKGKLARFTVIFAGPLFNFILAFILSFIVVSIKGYNMPVVAALTENSPALEAGIKENDIIYSVNNDKIHNSSAVSLSLADYRGDSPVNIGIIRNGKKQTIRLTPRLDEKSGRYLIGVQMSYERVKGNFFDNLLNGYYEMTYFAKSTAISLKMLVTNKASVSDMVGPIGISSVVGRAIQGENGKINDNAIFNLMNLASLISVNLGIMNLLPIPAFDGGRLFLILIELLRGKKLKPQTEERVLTVGFMIIVGLSVIILFNDVVRLIR